MWDPFLAPTLFFVLLSLSPRGKIGGMSSCCRGQEVLCSLSHIIWTPVSWDDQKKKKRRKRKNSFFPYLDLVRPSDKRKQLFRSWTVAVVILITWLTLSTLKPVSRKNMEFRHHWSEQQRWVGHSGGSLGDKNADRNVDKVDQSMSFKWEHRNKNCIRHHSCYVTVKNGYIFSCSENQSETEFKSNRLIYLKQEILGCRMVITHNF